MKYLILADDLTGALDTGVQCVRKGDRVIIKTQANKNIDMTEDTDVMVINTGTRHKSSEDAYQIVYELAERACQAGVNHLYKKTDSALRGNVGAELAAVLDATKQSQLVFVPAYPKMRRTTANGLQYIDGIELSKSVFADDILDPVYHSNICDLIHLQSDIPVTLEKDAGPNTHGVIVYDCKNEEEMKSIAEELSKSGKTNLLAGCAGLFEALPHTGGFEKRINKHPKLSDKLLVMSGSMNSITAAQLERAENNGAYRCHLPISEIVNGNWTDNDKEQYLNKISEMADGHETVILDTLPENSDGIETVAADGEMIAAIMGEFTKTMLGKLPQHTLMIIGGDTLQGFVDEMGVTSLIPITELEPGTVLAVYKTENSQKYLITKSGGFGDSGLIQKVQEKIASQC